MARKRFKEVGMSSFFGQFAYEQVVPRSHFLVKLNEVVKWDKHNDLLIPAYKGLGKTGRPPYPPVVLLKMLVIAYLYGFSERQVEEATYYHLAIKNARMMARCAAASETFTANKHSRPTAISSTPK